MTETSSYSAETINWAASIFRDPASLPVHRILAIAYVNAWRTAHEGAVARMRMALTLAAETVDANAVVASRLKRLQTIMDKCSRLPSGVTLWEMQDIGGLRVIVDTPEQAVALSKLLRDVPPPRFRFEWENDYICRPKTSGYRSIHHIYSHVPAGGDDPRLAGLRVEVQIRSRRQHLWATANEIVGFFRREDLKSSKGDPEWRRYFVVAGSVLAQGEGCALGPNVPHDLDTLRDEMETLELNLKAFEKITAYTMTPKVVGANDEAMALYGAGYASVAANLPDRMLKVKVFRADQFALATSEVQRLEKEHIDNPDMDVVLVHLDRLSQLEEAYPNYWADAGEFLRTLHPDWQDRLDADGVFH